MCVFHVFHIASNPQPASRSERREIKRAVTSTKISNIWRAAPKWKANGEDGIFTALLANNEDLLAGPMAKIIRSAFYLGHCPSTWQTSKVIFLGKEGKTDGADPKSFRPISLTSAVLKLAETLMKNRLLEKLNFMIHSRRQHAYKKASSTESAILKAVSTIAKQLNSTIKLRRRKKGKVTYKESKGLALVITVDYSGAFDILFHEAVYKAMKNSGASNWMINFIRACNQTRLIRTSMDNYATAYRPTLGTPQGAVFSPTCFNLVMDELLDTLGKGEMGCLGGAEVIGFADDIMIIIPFNESSFDEAFALANKKMERMRRWSESKGLKINPSKTAYAIIHRGNSDLIDAEVAKRELMCDGKSITRHRSFRYLGIWIDEKMTWNRQLEEANKKGSKTLIATARMLGKTYGLSPLLTKWVYKSICLPRMTYACFAWWDGTPKQCNKLEGTRSVAMRMITGAMRAAPIAILEGLTGLPKVCDVVEQLSANTAARLHAQGRWPLEQQRTKGGNYQSALMSAKGLTLPEKMVPQRPIGSHPFRVKENNWETNPHRRPFYTYILKDVAQKNMRWVVRGNEVHPVTTKFKCNYKSALALQHAIASTGPTVSKHYATDDAALIIQAKQRYLNPTLLDCADKLEGSGATRVIITRCPSLTSREMQGVYNAIVSQISFTHIQGGWQNYGRIQKGLEGKAQQASGRILDEPSGGRQVPEESRLPQAFQGHIPSTRGRRGQRDHGLGQKRHQTVGVPVLGPHARQENDFQIHQQLRRLHLLRRG
jgi:Reverse transcriptase (RNA-dependent DNA polymerase)